MNWQRLLRSRLPKYEQRPHGLRTAYAVATPVLALLVCEWFRELLAPLYEAPFLFATMVVAWLCGPWYAAGASIVSAALLDFFFLVPTGSLGLQDAGAVLRFIVFLASNAAITALVTFLHGAKSDLETSEQRYRSVSDLLPFGAWTASTDGAMLHVSESFLRAFGATLEQCRGEGWLDFIEPSQREQVRADWRECVRSGYFWDYEYRMQTPSGATYVVLSRGVPVRSRSGRVRSWVGMHLDITAMHSALEERVAQARDLARFNAELDQFAYISAHDLQEPLRMIASYLQLLERRYRGKLDEQAETYISYAVEGATRLRSLLQDLLVLQQIGKSNRPRVRQPLTPLVRTVIDGLPAGASIRVDELPEVYCDAVEFRLLFSSLLDNALKYAQDEALPQICVFATTGDDGCVISVSDNGIGIAPEYHQRIFDVFQRLHSRARYPGTGIGLAIAKKVVEVHGGKIWVESAPGRGATFHFTVPC